MNHCAVFLGNFCCSLWTILWSIYCIRVHDTLHLPYRNCWSWPCMCLSMIQVFLHQGKKMGFHLAEHTFQWNLLKPMSELTTWQHTWIPNRSKFLPWDWKRRSERKAEKERREGERERERERVRVGEGVQRAATQKAVVPSLLSPYSMAVNLNSARRQPINHLHSD